MPSHLFDLSPGRPGRPGRRADGRPGRGTPGRRTAVAAVLALAAALLLAWPADPPLLRAAAGGALVCGLLLALPRRRARRSGGARTSPLPHAAAPGTARTGALGAEPAVRPTVPAAYSAGSTARPAADAPGGPGGSAVAVGGTYRVHVPDARYGDLRPDLQREYGGLRGGAFEMTVTEVLVVDDVPMVEGVRVVESGGVDIGLTPEQAAALCLRPGVAYRVRGGLYDADGREVEVPAAVTARVPARWLHPPATP
ncbi:hypothetical protein GCM10010466_27940 [Planomonospora alba]|uniref:Uncharacterized protein n=1 Tax=Planomonospora alba TaxID=161354 RepID=A0ABP6N3S4_9ACTN